MVLTEIIWEPSNWNPDGTEKLLSRSSFAIRDIEIWPGVLSRGFSCKAANLVGSI